MPTALYPGSFDPIHLGHLSIIERAAVGFDRLVVAAVANPNKSSGMFTRSERAQLIRAATAHLGNVEVVEGHGLVVEVARSVGADVLIRAAHKETADERMMATANEKLSGYPTFFVPGDTSTSHISSSLIRDLVDRRDFELLGSLVSPPVASAILDQPSTDDPRITTP